VSATTLVLVDDDDAARRMMRRVLERRGFEVHDAADGASGLALARELLPGAVLLDLRMPGELSGFDVARELRADDATAAIPIVVVSASTHLDARELVAKVGCDAFVEKPVDFDELDSTLDRLLG
jgi:DNA-binding response OmpR family regulator